jgi:hypothetical protein
MNLLFKATVHNIVWILSILTVVGCSNEPAWHLERSYTYEDTGTASRPPSRFSFETEAECIKNFYKYTAVALADKALTYNASSSFGVVSYGVASIYFKPPEAPGEIELVRCVQEE